MTTPTSRLDEIRNRHIPKPMPRDGFILPMAEIGFTTQTIEDFEWLIREVERLQACCKMHDFTVQTFQKELDEARAETAKLNSVNQKFKEALVKIMKPIENSPWTCTEITAEYIRKIITPILQEAQRTEGVEEKK